MSYSTIVGWHHPRSWSPSDTTVAEENNMRVPGLEPSAYASQPDVTCGQSSSSTTSPASHHLTYFISLCWQLNVISKTQPHCFDAIEYIGTKLSEVKTYAFVKNHG